MTEQVKLHSRKLTLFQIYGLAALLILPCVALLKVFREASSNTVFLGVSGALLVIQTLAFFQTRNDKMKAQAGEWRTPESALHTLELLGGWPAAFIAQRRYRHKTSKRSYQNTFWFVILLHQLVALDYLCNWLITRKVLTLLPALEAAQPH